MERKLSRYVAFHLEVSKCITRIYVKLILTAILISRHHPILYTRALKTNSCLNQSKLCLLQSHSSCSSTCQHHSLVPQPDACQTLNELVQGDTQTGNKSHFCSLSLQTDCFIRCSLELIVKPRLRQKGGWEKKLEQDCDSLDLFQFKLSWACTLRHKGLCPRVIHRPSPSMSGPEIALVAQIQARNLWSASDVAMPAVFQGLRENAGPQSNASTLSLASHFQFFTNTSTSKASNYKEGYVRS